MADTTEQQTVEQEVQEVVELVGEQVAEQVAVEEKPHFYDMDEHDERLKKLKAALASISFQEGSDEQEWLEFMKYVQLSAERLEFLLFAKTDKYEGPLYDNYQKNEWPIITLIVSSWLKSVMAKVPKTKAKVDFKLTDDQIISITVDIGQLLLTKNIIRMPEVEKQLAMAALTAMETKSYMEKQLELLRSEEATLGEKVSGCLSCLTRTATDVLFNFYSLKCEEFGKQAQFYQNYSSSFQ